MPLFVSRRQRFLHRYGPWAVVTGASSGIGEACAIDLARRGLNIVLAGRDPDRLAAVAEQVTRLGLEARPVFQDMGEDGAAERLMTATAALDVGLLVAAAGYGDTGPFLESDPAVLADMLRVNGEAVLLQSHGFGRRFAARKRGGLVLFASLVGRQGTPWAAAYAATKGYVQLLSEGIAPELKAVGVDVLVAAPGPVRTGFGERARLRVKDADEPGAVARDILEALGKKVVMTPGAHARRLTAALSTLPRGVRSRILGGVMREMAVGREPA